MIPTEEDLKKLWFQATLYHKLDRYVYLRKDNKGFYIEYAFLEGSPHDNRCLSWYDSYQEKAYIRNGWVNGLSKEEKKERLDVIQRKRENRVGGIFELHSFTCGHEESPEASLEQHKRAWEQYHPDEEFIPEDHICKVGHPAPKCKECQCKHWTYKEPVKCACWFLDEPDIPRSVSIPIETALKLQNYLIESK